MVDRKDELDSFQRLMEHMQDEYIVTMEEIYRKEKDTNDFFGKKYEIIKKEAYRRGLATESTQSIYSERDMEER